MKLSTAVVCYLQCVECKDVDQNFAWIPVKPHANCKYFFSIYYGPYSCWKFLILVHLFANFFLETLLVWWLKYNKYTNKLGIFN